MSERSEIVEQLNDLLEKNVDAQRGYDKVAEKTESTYLKNLFLEKAKMHGDNCQELKTEIRQIGGETEDGGTVAGTLHRAWIDVKHFLSIDDDEALLEACINGEQSCLEEYEEAMGEEGTLASTRTMLQAQCSRVKASLVKMKHEENLRD